MVELVYEPSVHVVAATRMEELGLWEEDLGVEVTDDSPLGILATRASLESAGPEELVEFAGRHCYRSWHRGREHADYLRNILAQGHGSVLEHASISFAISGISRACSHELVRHRAGIAWSQESQRYVDASDIRMVVPPLLGPREEPLNGCGAMLRLMHEEFERDVDLYKRLVAALEGRSVARKQAREAARAVLPNAAETRLVMTANLRALRHFLELRGSAHADAEIRRLAIAVLEAARPHAPVVLEDMAVEDGRITCEYRKV